MIATSRGTEQTYAPLFADLFQYIHESLLTEASIDPDADDFDVLDAIRVCNGKFSHVQQFCIETDVDFESLQTVLSAAGAGCDCEVLLNASVELDDQQELRMW